ncbi:MAG: RtcB family protein [Planctomycetota bacterium]
MMTDSSLPPLSTWLVDPVSKKMEESIHGLRIAVDVERIAVLPDVHLAQDICNGVVVATNTILYPAAVGGDIGCGMAAIAFDLDSRAFADERNAAHTFRGLYESVPSNKHRKAGALTDTLCQSLSVRRLTKLAHRDGAVQMGTIGRGNHFVELQADGEDRIWLMVHTGSRAMGQSITKHHLERSTPGSGGLVHLNADAAPGQDYLHDMNWARIYARENRLAILRAVERLLNQQFHAKADWSTLIHGDHNHVLRESHFGKDYWVHRKGAQSAGLGEPGIIPGSMGTSSFHVAGRGEESSLRSCSHGAGRRLSRTEACKSIGVAQFHGQMKQVWFDHRLADRLREESPAAYKDIRAVLRAQRPLVKVVRELRPLLSYKGV